MSTFIRKVFLLRIAKTWKHSSKKKGKGSLALGSSSCAKGKSSMCQKSYNLGTFILSVGYLGTMHFDISCLGGEEAGRPCRWRAKARGVGHTHCSGMPWPVETHGNILSQLHYLYNALKFNPFMIFEGETMAGVRGRPLFSQRLVDWWRSHQPFLIVHLSVKLVSSSSDSALLWWSQELRFPKV